MSKLGMSKRKKRLSGPESQGILPYRIDPEPLTGATSFSGLPLMAEAYRALNLHNAVSSLVGIKQRAKGATDAQMIESILLMIAGGGECIDDLKRLREEPALGELLGYMPPSPDAARNFLYGFHDDAIMAERPTTPNTAWVPAESCPLKGLAEVNRQLIAGFASLLPAKKSQVATLDHDATVISSTNREAMYVYKGGRGYQPVFVVWAEMDVVVADEFRDGNVPAGAFNLPLIKRSFDSLPVTVKEKFFRADSACYDQAVLSYLRHQEIGFAVSADMSVSLRATIAALPEKAWKPHDEGREYAEVLFVPSTSLFEPNEIQADRYIAIRKKPRQPTLWEQDGYSYWAVVTNLTWRAKKILEWQRQKAGTIEHFHLVAKQELALGVMPCGRFGADAAWARINVLAFNLLEFLKRTALPPSLKRARPKRLRFEIFRIAGVIVRHARCVVIKLACSAHRIAAIIHARFQLAGVALALSG
jgi:hypothetical protein